MTITFWGLEVNWLAQIFGLIAAVPIFWAYLCKDKKKLLIVSIVANFISMIQCAILFAYTNIIKLGIGNVRNFFIIGYIKKKKPFPILLTILFSALVVVPSAFFINTWYAVIPPILSVLYTISICQKNELVFRNMTFFSNIADIIYQVFIGAYITAIIKLIIQFSMGIGLFRFIKDRKKQRLALSESNSNPLIAKTADNNLEYLAPDNDHQNSPLT